MTLPSLKKHWLKKGKKRLFILTKKGKVHLTKVTVKEQVDGYSVEKGLAVDEQYIVDPDKRLTEGKEVEVFE